MTATKDVLTVRTIGGLVTTPAGEIKRERKINMLLYGEPGVGKTVLAASSNEVPELRKTLLVDVEGGTMSIERKFPAVDIVRVTDFGEIQHVYDELSQDEAHGYNMVILDSLTEMQKLAMSRRMRLEKMKDPDIEVEVPRMRDWGVNLEQMRTMVRAFRDLPIHTIITALAKEDQDNRTGARIVRPSLTGKLASEVAGFYDIVAYLYVKEDDGVRRVLTASATENVIAKDRSDLLPKYIVDPKMQTIFNHIMERNVTDD